MASITVVATTNETNFGAAFADATALILDALPNIGEARAVPFQRAKERAKVALGYTENPEEIALVKQFLSYIAVAEQRRWNY